MYYLWNHSCFKCYLNVYYLNTCRYFLNFSCFIIGGRFQFISLYTYLHLLLDSLNEFAKKLIIFANQLNLNPMNLFLVNELISCSSQISYLKVKNFHLLYQWNHWICLHPDYCAKSFLLIKYFHFPDLYYFLQFYSFFLTFAHQTLYVHQDQG